MKRKEYYQVGRLLCVLGFLLLAAEAIWNPIIKISDEYTWEDYWNRPFSEGVYSLLADWKILIPIGFLVMGIAGRRWLDIVCSLLTAVSGFLFFGFRMETSFYGERSWLKEKVWHFYEHYVVEGMYTEEYMPRMWRFYLLTALGLGVVLTAVIRLFAVKHWRPVCFVLGGLLALLGVFFAVSAIGYSCRSENFIRVLEWFENRGDKLFCFRHAVTVFRVMIFATVAAAITECAAEIIPRENGEEKG